MDKQFLYDFMKTQALAVLTSISEKSLPQAALIGIVVTPELEIVFDTTNNSRKYQNLIQNPAVALVIGWDNETTLQYEGIATLLTSADTFYRQLYFDTFKDARQRAETKGIVHFKISPQWIRYSSFNEPMMIKEFKL
jgi:uncharacterized pyridoxamine 5'-phosphate oxidase family protein